MTSADGDRTEPRCVHFGTCGGCQHQDLSYPSQLELKRERLTTIFAEAGLASVPEIRVHAASEWEYRNRIRLRFQPSADGFEAGYSRRGSNDFLAIRMCPIAAPLLSEAAFTMLRLGSEDPLWRRWLGAVSEVELFTTADEARLQLRFFLRDDEAVRREPGLFAAACERLRSGLPGLAGAGAELDPELNRRLRRRWAGVSWGASGLNYRVAGRDYWVSRGAFFQVNRWLVDRLVALVSEAEAGELAWDLFAGVGLFSQALAERFHRVVAVEGGEAAAADLQAAARQAKFLAVHAPTLDFLRAHALQRERPGLLVVDPPRAGLGPAAAELLARVPAARMVYVSCDPVTLASDLVLLTGQTFRIESIDLLDLFPQTSHIETVVKLVRAGHAPVYNRS